jgi:hypothetical protein
MHLTIFLAISWPANGPDLVKTKAVLHNIDAMKMKLRNVTVTLEESVARWARIEAARQNTTVCRLLGAIIKECMLKESGYESAMRRALARKPFLKTEGRFPSREETHDRSGLR